ncbi:ABC transporter ATP-binding protein [Cellulomonas hominis]|uniref:ABC transporter ATP-binding protein n=1 Tax=Cellulomonas hominis TaxID=156981 RepID=UPI001B95FDA2|nr:ABC transporter ATP-binding protein [Cellulomonas hominis]VTR75924.1 Lipoprotein-releasing system ATP-binding protein LolD [Cellulomonas hominis]
MSPIVRARGVRKAYRHGRSRRHAPDVLRAVDLDVGAGEFVAVVGRSGSGKSTLLYCLSGLLTADDGSIVVDGVPLDGASHSRLARFRREHVGFVFQHLNLIESAPAAGNVALPARLAGVRTGTASVNAALDTVGLSGRRRARPHELSGGEQQKVAIARALVRRPPVLFADEPTGSLDVAATIMVMELFREVVAAGTTLVMVTHDLEIAARADRVVVLADGIVDTELERPSVEQIFAAMAHGSR